MSLPSRGAWIEIEHHERRGRPGCVAPLTGSVDRNAARPCDGVAARVAPLTGSVDRNLTDTVTQQPFGTSLPSRGAWIEIVCFLKGAQHEYVAPLTGSVDRNLLRDGILDILDRVAPLTGSVDRN